jgi:tRNA A-37 threonylcarbamoyl transferase component Bud32
LLLGERALSKYADDPMLGQCVADRFDIVDVIGVGGFGAVYRAIQQPVGRHVALKLIRPQLQHREQARARFFREARIVATLKDATIVTLYDYGEDGNALFAAFELVDGVPLDVVLAGGRLDIERATRLSIEVLRALAVAHRGGLIHRDIKPANIMILTDQFGQETVKVLDFGIAKVLERIEGEAASVETQAGAMLGTPRYMSPEQARGDMIDARADLYSLAVVLYEMLSGRAPFVGTSLETAVAHATRQPPDLDASLDLPPALVEVVFTALAKDKKQRFTSATSMAEALLESMPGLGYTNSFVEVSSSVNLAQSAGRTASIELATTAEVAPQPARSWMIPAIVVGALIATGLLLMLSDGDTGTDAPASTPSVAPATAPATAAPATAAPATAAPATAAPATAAPATAAPATAAPATAAPSRAPRARRPVRPVSTPKRPASTPSVPPTSPSTITVPEF